MDGAFPKDIMAQFALAGDDVKKVTAATTLLPHERTVAVLLPTDSGGNYTITLPPVAEPRGAIFVLYALKTNNAGVVTVAANSADGAVSGFASATLDSQYDTLVLLNAAGLFWVPLAISNTTALVGNVTITGNLSVAGDITGAGELSVADGIACTAGDITADGDITAGGGITADEGITAGGVITAGSGEKALTDATGKLLLAALEQDGATDGQVIKWNNTGGVWEPAADANGS